MLSIKLPKVITNSTLYSFASFFQKGVGFFLIPLYTAYLTPEDYGTLNLINSVIGFLGILYLLSLNGAASKFHFSKSDRKPVVWGTILMMVLANSFVLGTICIVFHRYLIDPLTGSVPFWRLTVLSLVCSMFSPVYGFYQQWLQNEENGKRYTINLLLNWFLTLVLNIVFIVYFRLGVFGMILSSTIVAVIFFVYAIKEFLPFVSFRFDKEIAKEATSYSLPLVPHTVSGYLSVMADRVILNRLASLSNVGLYSIASQFGIILNTVTTSINQAFTPWFYREVSKDEIDNEKLNKFTELSIAVCSFVACMLVFFSPEVVRVMASEAYASAWEPILFISFGYVFNGLYFFFSKPLFYFQPKFVMVISISQLVVNIALNILLIPSFGYIGTGIAFLSSMAVSTLVSLYLNNRYCPKVKFNSLRLYIQLLFFLAYSSIVYVVEYNFRGFECLAIKIVLSMLMLAICYLIYKNELIKYIKQYRHAS